MKRIVFLVFFCFLLGGCTPSDPKPISRVVTGIEVQYRQNEKELHRVYTRDSSMQSVLNYLRMLHPSGPVTPEEESQNTCRITIQYSTGEYRTFLQTGDRYLRTDGNRWQKVDTVQAKLLYPLLLLLPSDTP